MKTFSLSLENIKETISAAQIEALREEMVVSNNKLHDGSGAGSDFLGWVSLPSSITEAELDRMESVAAALAAKSDVIVVVGIGGSYLGTKAVLEAMNHQFAALQPSNGTPTLLFAGQNLSEDYLYELLETVRTRSLGVIVISKSGTTTEPAVAFRLLKSELESRYGKEEAASRIVAVTDEARGALRSLATQEGYETFVIPDNVGGRYSILTPVGLLPLAAAGISIRDLVEGARTMEQQTAPEIAFEDNLAMQYAAARTALYRAGKKIEILGSYDPRLSYVAEWWKQLYGESEGKEGKGLFPASVTLTADLHSMGQYIQEGERTLLETIISIESAQHEVRIEADDADLDGLNFLAGRRVGEVNRMAELGTLLAHVDGGVPNIRIELPKLDAYYMGALLYFFEKACGISGYALGVNPFDQPGVEAYKRNMFALLGKPGYEDEGDALRARL